MAHTSRTRGIEGQKAQLIIELLNAHPTWNRQEIANEALCSVARVGEVVRYLEDHAEATDEPGAGGAGLVVWLPGVSKEPIFAVEHPDADRWIVGADGRLDLGKTGAVGVLAATYSPHNWISVALAE